MFFILNVLYYYLVKKYIGKDTSYICKYKYKIVDKNYNKKIEYKINTLIKKSNIYNKELYYVYNGYRFLSNFPKKWLETIDKYENIGLKCKNCLFYCCLQTEGELPLFLGFCTNCYSNFLLQNDNYCEICEFCIDRFDCHDCIYCITNVIDYTDEIINVLHNNKGNKKMLENLIVKLNNEYGNLNTM